jgi:hypothetical protein
MQIYQSIANIMTEVSAIGKNNKNAQQGYNFRGIDDLYNAIHPLFARNGVFITSDVVGNNREERTTAKGGLLLYTILRVKFTFYAIDGSSVFSIVEGEAMDSGDKSTNKAMSAALKYALMQMLLIPTEELKDADKDTYSVAAKVQKPIEFLSLPTKMQDLCNQLFDISEQLPEVSRAKANPFNDGDCISVKAWANSQATVEKAIAIYSKQIGNEGV